ncbi:putative gag-polypeptide of LTR copia-type [Lupinus albus]|uniref:Putative gag-polypeptide of LTR copia-type n=1 Tax=Lupinus albus TaxID=3870 RepID=A0A6A4NFB3_LUPAL|nr:putative gag-polypeptide of LTR copia-type [Lupinus albus]
MEMASSISSTIPVTQSIDATQDPYYIHPSENPGATLVSPTLIGENYHQWSRSMMMSLITKHKVDFIYGSIQMPLKEDPSFIA